MIFLIISYPFFVWHSENCEFKEVCKNYANSIMNPHSSLSHTLSGLEPGRGCPFFYVPFVATSSILFLWGSFLKFCVPWKLANTALATSHWTPSSHRTVPLYHVPHMPLPVFHRHLLDLYVLNEPNTPIFLLFYGDSRNPHSTDSSHSVLWWFTQSP